MGLFHSGDQVLGRVGTRTGQVEGAGPSTAFLGGVFDAPALGSGTLGGRMGVSWHFLLQDLGALGSSWTSQTWLEPQDRQGATGGRGHIVPSLGEQCHHSEPSHLVSRFEHRGREGDPLRA